MDTINCCVAFGMLQYLALGNVPSELPFACLELNYLSMRINFNDIKENKAAFCLLKSSPNLSELEVLVSVSSGIYLSFVLKFPFHSFLSK